ncbi:hypothetical protein L208DRAFT_1265108, partial [Tricholoma matsutake]
QFSGGNTWGLFTTDSFGMGMDIPDVELVVQWKATCTLSTLWQRFGCAGRMQVRTQPLRLLLFFSLKCSLSMRYARRKRRQKMKGVVSVPIKWPCIHEGTQATSTVLQTEEYQAVDVKGSSDDSADECENKLEERHVRYLELGNKPGKRKSTKHTLEPVMDDLINASTQEFPCR